MITQTNTNGVDFLLNVLQAVVQTNGTSLNSNTVGSIPQLVVAEAQAALVQAGRVPGGQAYLKGSNGVYIPPGPTGVVGANTNAGVLSIAGFETRPSKLNTTKSAAFLVTVNATAVNVSLQALGTNTNANVGDTTFANWNQIIFLNPSGLGIDNTAAVNATITSSNTNGANIGVIPINATGGYVLQAGGAVVAQAWNGNGTAITTSTLNIVINSTGLVNLVGLICGS